MFSQFSERVQRQSYSTGVFDDEVLERLAKIIRDCLQHSEVRLEVKGSIAKGTQTRHSDVDIIIDTPGRDVSRADKERVVERLKKSPPLFHRSHVHLKRHAISCILLGTDVDLVFSSTVEYGQLPRGNERFTDNPAAQQAASALKIGLTSPVSSSKPCQPPNFVLELLILEAQHARLSGGDFPPDKLLPAIDLYVDAMQVGASHSSPSSIRKTHVSRV
jgi:predicted nucleotidyltransferase